MEMGKTPHARRRSTARARSASRSLDDALAGRGVHPGAVHGRHPRAAVPRVRGHHLRRDPRLGLVSLTLTPMLCSRFLRPHAHERSTAGSTARPSGSSTACCGVYDAHAAVGAAAPAGRRWRCSVADARGARSTCSCVMPKGFIPERGHRADLRRHARRRRTCRSRRWCAHQQAVAAIVRGTPTSSTFIVVRRRRRRQHRDLQQGRIFIRLKPRDERPRTSTR